MIPPPQVALVLLLVGPGQGVERRAYPRRPPGPAGLQGLLQGLDINLLDSKFLGLGYVRQDLVEELCSRATLQLVREGEQRAKKELMGGGLVAGLEAQVEDKCQDLLLEGEKACSGVLDMVNTRFTALEGDTKEEAEEQCVKAQELTVEMVKQGAAAAYENSAGLGRELAGTEFRRQVEVEKNRGERMFQEEVERNRAIAEKELRRRVEEGRLLGEEEFKREVTKGKEEGEREYLRTVEEERRKGEELLAQEVAKGREEGEEVFQREVAKGRAEAERLFAEREAQGREDGERICSEMITVACQNATEATDSFDFCEEFFFFTDDLGDERRRKRQEHHLYGNFYNKFH